jgi:hypothetical protein
LCSGKSERKLRKKRELLKNNALSIHTTYSVVKPFSIPYFDSFHAVFATEDAFRRRKTRPEKIHENGSSGSPH